MLKTGVNRACSNVLTHRHAAVRTSNIITTEGQSKPAMTILQTAHCKLSGYHLLPHHPDFLNGLVAVQRQCSIRPYSTWPSESSGNLTLMDISMPRKTLLTSFRNIFEQMRLRLLDRSFSPKTFVQGADMAVETISQYLANGELDNLEGLVEQDALEEIRGNYEKLDLVQRQSLQFVREKSYIRGLNTIRFITIDDKECVVIWMTYFKSQSLEMFLEAKKSGKPPPIGQQGDTSVDIVAHYWFRRQLEDEEDWTVWKLNYDKKKSKVQVHSWPGK